MQSYFKIAVYISAIAFIIFPILLLQILKLLKLHKSVIWITLLLMLSAIFIAILLYSRFMLLSYTGERSRNWLLTFYGTVALLIFSPIILINGAKRILYKESVPELFVHNFYLGVTGFFCWLMMVID